MNSDFDLTFPIICTLGRMWVGARPLSDGGMHVVVWHADGRRPTFYELMAVKDAMVGADRQAVEIYPPRSELVDEGGNSATHLWALPAGREVSYILKPRGEKQFV
jgi:hypothetical protein